MLLICFYALAQSPPELPHPKDNHPIDLTNPADLILYIVLPLVIIFLFFIWRAKKKNDIDNNKNP